MPDSCSVVWCCDDAASGFDAHHLHRVWLLFADWTHLEIGVDFVIHEPGEAGNPPGHQRHLRVVNFDFKNSEQALGSHNPNPKGRSAVVIHQAFVHNATRAYQLWARLARQRAVFGGGEGSGKEDEYRSY